VKGEDPPEAAAALRIERVIERGLVPPLTFPSTTLSFPRILVASCSS